MAEVDQVLLSTRSWDKPSLPPLYFEEAAGESTWSILDDEYLISGTATSAHPNGVSFTLITLQPVLWAVNCKHLKSGTLELTSTSGNYSFQLDYGNGTCDNQAVLTGPNGNTYNITLK